MTGKTGEMTENSILELVQKEHFYTTHYRKRWNHPTLFNKHF